MKILIVHYRYFISGGPERYLFNVKEALEKRGHEVVPFSIKNSKNIPSKYSEYFVDNIGKSNEVFINKYPKTLRTYVDLITREFYSIKVKRSLKALIRDTHPALCYLLVYKRALSPSVIEACAEMGLPIVNRISDYNTVCGASSLYRDGLFCDSCFRDRDKSCFKYRCVKGSWLYSSIRYLSIQFFNAMHFESKIHGYVCTNGFMREMMVARGYPMNKLHIIPTFFNEQSTYKEMVKTECWDSEKVKFLFIGNIDESKGIYDLIQALSLLKKCTQKFHLTIVGGLHIEENQKVMDLLDKEELNEYVTFNSFRSDGKVFEYYLDNHLTIIPARWVENLPNTLIESLYFHRPVVVPRWGSFKYTTNESVAFYYNALSTESLAETLYAVINNKESIQQKSDACEVFFNVNYAEEIHIKQLLELFENTIK